MYEPKNRESASLPVLEILVDHADGTRKTCPNGSICCLIYALEGTGLPEASKGFLASGSEVFNPLELKPIDGVKSVISGKPAVVYRADDLAIPLTPEELMDLFGLNLSPDAFFKLRDHYGVFYEIHDDFYDPDTGAALQSKIEQINPAPRP